MRMPFIRLGLLLLLFPPALPAQTPDSFGKDSSAPMPLGELIEKADRILVLRVDRVERKKNQILFKYTDSLKGKAERAGVHVEAPQDPSVLEWARPGKKAVCFIHQDEKFICLGNRWLSTKEVILPGGSTLWKPIEWYVEMWPTTYIGSVERLCDHVRAIQAGRRVIVTARAPESCFDERRSPIPLDWRRGQKGRVWRIEAGTKVKSPHGGEDSPEFVGWGIGGPEVVPGLIRVLRDRDECVRAEAVEDMGRLGAIARPARPALRELLRNPDPYVRVYTVLALARIEPEAPSELSIVLAALKERDLNLRVAAIDVLAELGGRAESTLDRLSAILSSDRDFLIQNAAIYALGRIGAQAAAPRKAVLALARLLRSDSDYESKRLAIRALVRLGSATWEAVPALNTALVLGDNVDIKTYMLSRAAARVLARLEPAPVEVLAKAHEASNGLLPGIAYELALLGPNARTAVPTLRRLVRKGLADNWEEAAALVHIEGAAAAPLVLPALIPRVEKGNSDPDTNRALAALARLGPAARSAVPAIALALKDAHSFFSEEAAEALGRIGSGPAVNALRSLSEASGAADLRAAAKALARLGEQRDAVRLLTRALARSRVPYPAEVALALAELGPQARAAAPALQRALGQTKGSGRGCLAWALWCVQHPLAFDRPRRRAGLALATIHAGKYETPFMASPWFIVDQVVMVEESLAIFEQTEVQLRLLASDSEPASALRRILKDRRPEARLVAALALAHLDPHDTESPVVLAKLLAHRFDRLPYIADTLAALGPRARAAIPSLREMQGYENEYLYRTATRLLRRIDPEAARATWNVLGARAGRPAAPLTPSDLRELWGDLAADPVRAYLAQCQLARAGAPAVTFLGQHLLPVRVIPAERIERLIVDLDSDSFATREHATAELKKILDQAEPLLRRKLASRPSLEVQRRIRRLLLGLDPFSSPERRRSRRALETLELRDSPEARAHLRRLETGVPEAWLTREAKASLGRMDHRAKP